MPQLLEQGVNVTPGCDGDPSNNDDDMIREMKLAAVIHKAVSINPLAIPAETALEMGRLWFQNSHLIMMDEHEVIAQANEQAYQVYQRAGMASNRNGQYASSSSG